MPKILTRILAGLLLFSLGGYLVLQALKIHRLQSENTALQEQLTSLQGTQPKNLDVSHSAPAMAEPALAPAEKAELLRLRNEVAQLRRQVKESAASAAAKGSNRLTNSDTPENKLPYRAYTAITRATLERGTTLVCGGWSLNSGKRVLVFVTPDVLPEEGGLPGAPRQVSLHGKIVEAPDAVVSQVGLDALNVSGQETTDRLLLSDNSFKQIISALEQVSGIDFLSCPAVTTLSDQQTQMKVVDVKSLPSGETYELGSMIDVVPRLMEDGHTFLMTVIARKQVPNNPPP